MNVLLLSPVFAFELAVYIGNVFVKRYELLGDRIGETVIMIIMIMIVMMMIIINIFYYYDYYY